MQPGLFLILFLSLYQGVLGQNLLSNESFELNTGNIATREMNFDKVNNWDGFTPSPDYIGANTSLYPYWPRPISGNFYVMIASGSSGSSFKESIGQKTALSESVTYKIKLKVCSYWNFQNIIQIFGLDEEPTVKNSELNYVYFQSNNLQWESPPIKGDTIWHTVEGCFKASKNIKYLVFVPKAAQMWMAIDDVVIEESDFSIHSKHILPADTILCNQSMGLDLIPMGLDSILSWSDGSKANTLHADTTGIYSVTGLQKNCPYIDSIYIQFLESPQVLLPKDTFICDLQSIRIDTKTAHHSIENSKWNTGDSGLFITTQTGGSYWIQVGNICGKSSDTIIVNSLQKPILELGGPIQNCDSIDIEINAFHKDIIDYLWSDGSRLPQNRLRYGDLGLMVNNNCGSASDTISITNENCECKIHFPNAFSPTNDQLNEKYTLITNCTQLTGTLRIYNRWGEKLFETTDLENGWNGYYRNYAIKGVYLAIFEIVTPYNERKIVSKTIHLL